MRKVLVFAAMTMALFSCSKECGECDEDEDSVIMESLLFPDGIVGEPVLFMADTLYEVPQGKALYILNCEKLFNETGEEEYYIRKLIGTGNDFSYGLVIIVPPGSRINSEGFLNGLLIENRVEVFSWYSDTAYVVSDGKNLYMTSFMAQWLKLDGIYVAGMPTDGAVEYPAPFFIPSGTRMEHNRRHIFTGYYRD